jgi:hypothetical protein
VRIGYWFSYSSNFLLVASNLAFTGFVYPIANSRLGPSGVGFFLTLFGLVNFVSLGIGWLSGAGQRLLIESLEVHDDFRTNDLLVRLVAGYLAYSLLLCLLLVFASAFVGDLFFNEFDSS